jgi:SGNH hydrolase-like domain, acetyltransferase AlgX
MRCALTVALWLGPMAGFWGLVASVARIQTVRAAAVANVLVAVALPLTYVAMLGAAVHVSARPRLAVMRAAALTLGLLTALALLELVAAVRLAHWEIHFSPFAGTQQFYDYVPDPDLGFRHAPNVRRSLRPRSDVEMAWGLPASRSDRITVTYDGHGYRNATELTRADIVLIGDSYVEGSYVSDDQVLSRILQARLGRPVANLGVAGYGTSQELVVLQRDAVALGPRVVIWFFFEGNDFYNDVQFENALLAPRKVRVRPWTAGHGWWRRSFLRNASVMLRLMLSRVAPIYVPHFGTVTGGPHRGRKVLFWPEAAVPWTEFEEGRWMKAQDSLKTAARVAREHGIELLLVYVPIKYRVYRDFVQSAPDGGLRGWTLWPLPDLFARFCRAEELACVDLTEGLRDAVLAGGMPHALTDTHWSPEGHALIAERLAGTLRALGWIPEPHSQSRPPVRP